MSVFCAISISVWKNFYLRKLKKMMGEDDDVDGGDKMPQISFIWSLISMITFTEVEWKVFSFSEMSEWEWKKWK